MAKKKPRTVRNNDRHLARKMVRIPDSLHQQMQELAICNKRPLSWECREAFEEHLRRNRKEPSP